MWREWFWKRGEPREFDIQLAPNPWLSLGVHIDHTDPHIALHLPGVIIVFGRVLVGSTFVNGWSLRHGASDVLDAYEWKEIGSEER